MPDNERIREIVLAASTLRDDGKRVLPCPSAFELAAEHGFELMDIARVCNREKIKFVQCQLGCFA